jgi:hypothetical protein
MRILLSFASRGDGFRQRRFSRRALQPRFGFEAVSQSTGQFSEVILVQLSTGGKALGRGSVTCPSSLAGSMLCSQACRRERRTKPGHARWALGWIASVVSTA